MGKIIGMKATIGLNKRICNLCYEEKDCYIWLTVPDKKDSLDSSAICGDCIDDLVKLKRQFK